MISRYAVKTLTGKVYYGFYDTVQDYLFSKLFEGAEYILTQLEDIKNNTTLRNAYCAHLPDCKPIESVVGYCENTIPGMNFEHNGHKVYICENCKCVLDGFSVYEAEEAQGIDTNTNV